MNRVVFLVDMNAFFMSCESSRRPELRGKPAAVAGDPQKRSGIILAASYEARAFGIKTTMTVQDAKRRCPELVLLPPDQRFYSARSKEVMELLQSFSPIVEQNSIDEAWLDMTGGENLFGPPLQAAKTIMDRIETELGLWCSIGIAENKFLSKMASELNKPHGISTIWPSEVPTKLWPLPVGHMYGIGRKSAEKLEQLQIFTIGELARQSINRIYPLFGKSSEEILRLANGQDDSPVAASDSDSIKSIGRSTTLSVDLTSLEAAKLVLMDLSEEVGHSARAHGKFGRTVQITLKYSDFKVITRQSSVPATNLTKDIIEAGNGLLEKNWSTSKPVRLIGISLTGFDEQTDQLSFFDAGFMSTGAEDGAMQGVQVRDERESRLESAIDSIRNKYGSDSLKRAALIKKGRNPR